MDYKTGKLHKIIRQFDKGNGTYEINGIDRQKAVFLYRKKAEAFIPIPKGNYRINSISDSMQELEIDNIINDVAVEFQIIYQFEIMSSKYEEQFPELDIVVMKLNQIVDDINNIVDYSNSVGIKSDSKFQTQILTPLEPLSVWYMNEEGLIDTIPIDSFNKKFTEIMSRMEELANEKANEKVEHHLNRLQQRITELKTEVEQKGSRELQSLSEKLTQSLEVLENKKNKFISDIEENTSNSLSVITRKGDETISNIENIKSNALQELNNFCPYRIGDIYITTNNTNPATIWIGTSWKKIEGKFLRGTNRNENSEINGGSDTKALTVSNLPAHSHSASSSSSGNHTHTQVAHSHTQPSHKHNTNGFGWVYRHVMGSNTGSITSDLPATKTETTYAGGENTGVAQPSINPAGNHSHTITIGNSGGGTAFDIKPAYITVHIWKRIS